MSTLFIKKCLLKRKFNTVKLKNEYKQSIKTSTEFLLILMRIIIFFLIFNAYMTFKYIYVREGLTKINHFTDVFNLTQFSQSNIVLSTNIAK